PRARDARRAGHRAAPVTYATLARVTDPRRPPDAGPALTAGDLAAATGGTLVRSVDRGVRGGAVDSRLVRPGNLFVALPGEHTDGHRFLRQAAEAGAAALLVQRDPVAG